MKLLVSVFNPDNMPAGAQRCEDGQPLTFHVTSPYLVSAGQSMPVGVTVFDYDLLRNLQFALKDARHLVREDGETPLVQVPIVWDVSFIPSRRSLADIMADVVQHGLDNPRHGVSCVCMDQFSREIRLQVSRAIPPDGRTTDSDWAKPIQERLNAKARIRYVLGMVERNL